MNFWKILIKVKALSMPQPPAAQTKKFSLTEKNSVWDLHHGPSIIKYLKCFHKGEQVI